MQLRERDAPLSSARQAQRQVLTCAVLHPGTRETEALRPGRLVQKAHAVLLTGGSAFGLDAAGGVVQYLEEQNVGFPAGPVRVPIVPAVVIFDLSVGDVRVRPDREMGYQACLNATDEPVAMGVIGAGTGATVGKAPGVTPSQGGVGSACKYLDSGLIVAAITVVNALGNVVHPKSGEIVAGGKEDGDFVDITERLLDANLVSGINTTIGVVATNAVLSPCGSDASCRDGTRRDGACHPTLTYDV